MGTELMLVALSGVVVGYWYAHIRASAKRRVAAENALDRRLGLRKDAGTRA